ncbi:Shikimate dehydrogenase (NADP(+)) [uncultured Defluviicoccus sp.]|uniref:shikimate dehydrogenase (NADP(+)) n=1 Tax=metagenome TaxID=256318 RepID=A0A380TL37_9ZZZZ|nr:Shikimate dehydrogenase (NADP(+)) [uncultured Defluviicoccus sp.]
MLSGRARIAGVIGWPVAHSLSPRLHGFWLRHYGIDGAYIPLPVAPQDLEAVVKALPKLGFAGANVTIPHKETVIAYLDHVAPLAQKVGAVNTLIVGPDGQISGLSTDGFGFLASLAASQPGWLASAGVAVVIGGGGAARAIVQALIEAGAPEIRLVNRTAARARALAEHLGGPITLIDWRDRAGALEGVSLLVNATSLGMRGEPPLNLALDALPREAVVADIVYVPLLTELLASAAARGNRVVDGLGMLLHQARPAFAAWFGIEPEVTAELKLSVLQAAQG